MEEDIREALRSILQAQRDQGQEIDTLSRSLIRLVRELEQDEREGEREDERDERRREKLAASIEDLKGRIETIGVALRDLPEKLLNTVEKKIYELRIARHEALQAGVANEPAPLMPAPTYREPTGRLRLPPPQPEEPEESMALTPAQQRGVFGILRRAWRHKWTIGGVTLLEVGHRIYDALKHAIGH